MYSASQPLQYILIVFLVQEQLCIQTQQIGGLSGLNCQIGCAGLGRKGELALERIVSGQRELGHTHRTFSFSYTSMTQFSTYYLAHVQQLCHCINLEVLESRDLYLYYFVIVVKTGPSIFSGAYGYEKKINSSMFINLLNWQIIHIQLRRHLLSTY